MWRVLILFANVLIAQSTIFSPIGQKTFDKIIAAFSDPSTGLNETHIKSIKDILGQILNDEFYMQLEIAVPVATLSAEQIRQIGALVIAESKQAGKVGYSAMGKFYFNIQARTREGIIALKKIADALITAPGLTEAQKLKITTAVEEFAAAYYELPFAIVPISKIISTAKLLELGAEIIRQAKTDVAINLESVQAFTNSAINQLQIQTLEKVANALKLGQNDTESSLFQLKTYAAMANSALLYEAMEAVYVMSDNKIQQYGQPLLDTINNGHEGFVQARYFVDNILGKQNPYDD